MKRITSIDFVRGLVMIIMALDHTREMMHFPSKPLDLATTTPALFFTRWITHLCAPTFVFLSGTSAYLSFSRQQDLRSSRRWLFSRGVWLILLEFTVITFAIWTDIHFRTLFFQVIATIGFGFIFLALLLKVNSRILGSIGLLLIFGHDLITLLPLPANPVLKYAISFLFIPRIVQPTPSFIFLYWYPVLPWFGIMLAGFACGSLFSLEGPLRKKICLRLGLACLTLFVLLRWINVYGDPSPWTVQKNNVFTFLSFINTTKTPPSLLFTLMTLGIMFLLLGLAEGKNNPVTRIISIYGKVPLFYYLVHLYVIHAAMFIMVFAQGLRPTHLDFGPLKSGRPEAGSGLSLPYVYLVWLIIVVGLYPLCRWYSRYKAGHQDNKWLRYI